MAERVSIVFEGGDGAAFSVHLDGLTTERRKETDAMTPERQLETLSPAEFWALRCFQITVHALKQSGAFHSTSPLGG